jgi:hypothetical protein
VEALHMLLLPPQIKKEKKRITHSIERVIKWSKIKCSSQIMSGDDMQKLVLNANSH